MSLIKLINIIESLKKNSKYQKKWNEISELLQDNFNDSLYENLFGLITRDIVDGDVLTVLPVMILKFPRELQIRIINLLKTIDNHAVYKIFQILPMDLVMMDFGILEYYFLNPSYESIRALKEFVQRDDTLIEKSAQIWIPQGINILLYLSYKTT